MRTRGAALTVAYVLALAGAAVAAGGFDVEADDMTLVRIPGAVPPKSCTLTANADAGVDQALPDTADGTAPTLAVAAGADDRRAFVRFDLASCAIPAVAEVRTATLATVLVSAPAADRSWEVRRATDPWTEAGLTWSTAPGVAAAPTDAVSTGVLPGETLAWDVTADVAAEVSGAVDDEGWRVADADEAPAAPVGGVLAAREDPDPDRRPTLTVTWFD